MKLLELAFLFFEGSTMLLDIPEQMSPHLCYRLLLGFASLPFGAERDFGAMALCAKASLGRTKSGRFVGQPMLLLSELCFPLVQIALSTTKLLLQPVTIFIDGYLCRRSRRGAVLQFGYSLL